MYKERGKCQISVLKRDCSTKEKKSKHTGRLYLLKDSNELDILADVLDFATKPL